MNTLREHRCGNQEWIIQTQWQYWVHKTQDEDKTTAQKIKRYATQTLQKSGLNAGAQEG